jgi:peptidoglycan/LPS O-acetylase OafA/YrhL
MRGRANNFDLLRLGAAALVLISHGYAVTGRFEPLTLATGRSLGHIGVLVFFAISGFLVTRSWLTEPSVLAYAAKRALRLLPALFVALLVCAFVIGPLVSGASPGQYFTSADPYRYVAQNALLRTSFQSLPGVFEGNPYPNSVNGSLWTLWWEVLAYGGVLVLAGLAMLRPRRALVAVAALVVFAWSMPQQPALWLLVAFGLGGLLYVHRDRVPLRGAIALVLLGIWVLSWKSRLHEPAAAVAFTYLTIYLALLPQLRATRWLRSQVGDVSYGVYLYAFPLEQVVVHLVGPPVSPWAVIGLAAPAILAAALISWRVVEAPSMRLKRQFSRVAGQLPRADLGAADSTSDAEPVVDPRMRLPVASVDGQAG